MLRRICTVQIIPRKPVLDRADYTAPILQHDPDHEIGIDDLSDVRSNLVESYVTCETETKLYFYSQVFEWCRALHCSCTLYYV